MCWGFEQHRTQHQQVRNAITRQRKEDTVDLLVEKMQSSSVVFGMRFKGLDVRCCAL